jgi:DNA-binding transcriptional LysR family regulator
MSYGIQQPAISGQLLQLERHFGTKLFHRRPFGLTSGGLKLFAEIEPFFAGLPELRGQVRGHASQRLRIAAPAAILRDYLPKILAKYKRRYRDFELIVHDANQASAEELLRKREIDLAICELEGRPAPPIESLTLLRIPLVLVVPEQMAFRTLSDFFQKSAPRQGLISLPPSEAISRNFHGGLKKLGLAWIPKIEVGSLELIDLYTSLGFGVGLSIAKPGMRRKRGLRALPLRRFPPLTIAVLRIGDLSGLAATFLADIKNLATQLSR